MFLIEVDNPIEEGNPTTMEDIHIVEVGSLIVVEGNLIIEVDNLVAEVGNPIVRADILDYEDSLVVVDSLNDLVQNLDTLLILVLKSYF